MAQILKAGPVVEALNERLERRIVSLKETGVTPALAIVRVGQNPADLSYERGARKRCEAAGVRVKLFALPADVSQEELERTITEVNRSIDLHGCLMLRPLPRSLDEAAACALLDPEKDVDCLTPSSLYGVFANEPTGFPPCTAEAVIATLDHYGIGLTGKRVTVVGRSLVIGKPVSMMLQARNATVTMCHTHTADMREECRRAEILVVAAGHAHTITPEFVSGGQVIVDVGINFDEETHKLCGDVDFATVEPLVEAITPVPGGLGTVTSAILCKHVVDAAERQTGRRTSR